LTENFATKPLKVSVANEEDGEAGDRDDQHRENGWV
jgi:hypothetical protein